MYAKRVFSIHKITTALANLCISVHYGKLNLMLPSASKSQKITFILMKCTKTIATGPPELLLLAQICTKSFIGWGFAPDPTGGAYSAPPDSLAGLGGGTPGERERGRGKGEEG